MSKVTKIRKKNQKRWQPQVKQISWNLCLFLFDVDGKFGEDNSQRWSKRTIKSALGHGFITQTWKSDEHLAQLIQDRNMGFIHLTAKGRAAVPLAAYCWQYETNINEPKKTRRAA